MECSEIPDFPESPDSIGVDRVLLLKLKVMLTLIAGHD